MNFDKANERLKQFGKNIGTDFSTVKKSLTVEPTDSEMLDWLIEESCTVLSFATGVLSRKYKVIDFHGDDVSVGDTAREAITKAMRGEK